MPSDTGVPVQYCGVATRAIPRAMVDLRSIICLFDTECVLLVDEGGKLSNL